MIEKSIGVAVDIKKTIGNEMLEEVVGEWVVVVVEGKVEVREGQGQVV